MDHDATTPALHASEGLDGFELQDSWILSISADPHRAIVEIDAVLTDSAEHGGTPPAGLRYRAQVIEIRLDAARYVTYLPSLALLARQASHERGVGNIDSFVIGDDGLVRIAGDWGELDVDGGTLTVTPRSEPREVDSADREWPSRARARMEEIRASLVGQRVAVVRYLTLDSDDPPPPPGHPPRRRRDLGDWHWPGMGVELTLESERKVSALWGWEIDHHNIELRDGPIRRLVSTSPDAGWCFWDASSTGGWPDVVGKRIDEAVLIGDELPFALRLGVDGQAVTIAAVEPRELTDAPTINSRGDLILGADEVMVHFGDIDF